MGYQDRDYYREGAETQFVTSVVVKLIIINVVCVSWPTCSSAGPNHRITEMLALNARHACSSREYWWQFLTAGFAHAGTLWPHLFNMLGLYVFGKPLEERFGSASSCGSI